ncbi:redoxin domain-containing protein [Streptomyces albus subsp. albus]|nr:redoxin domain-containing protein [Streptomyces albus subsp. albus]
MNLRRVSRLSSPVRRLAVGAVTAVLALAGCGAGGGGAAEGGNFQGSGPIGTVRADERRPAPDLSGTTLQGKPLDVADYRGQVVVVNLWASQCGPCRREAPSLAKVAKDTKARGVRFVGINTSDGSREGAARFEQGFGVPYPSLYDPMGRIVLRFPKGSINPQAIPATVVLDRKGRIAARALMPLTEGELRTVLKPLIAEHA